MNSSTWDTREAIAPDGAYDRTLYYMNYSTLDAREAMAPGGAYDRYTI